MDDVQFNSWTSLLEQRTGMYLPKERRSFLETNLGLRMKEIGIDNYESYYEHLLSAEYGRREWLILVDRLTVHETRFFRHQPSLDVLEEVFLPALFDSEPDRKKLQIWSAGCSTGEEVYTLGMVVDQYVKQSINPNCYLAITGMDISVPALVTARKALYEKYKVRHVPDTYLDNYFISLEDGRFQVISELKKRVCFVPFNIIDIKQILLEPMDIIVCQNVLIYFNRERRKQIIHQLVKRLKPGGFLMLGAGEALNNPHPELEKIDFPNSLAFCKKQ
jgi:chemotaxis protein methyltransferase CheR/type IV pilus assembly protein PilK